MTPARLPPNQHLAAVDKWPLVGERSPRQSAAPWTVTVSGEVEHPTVYSLDQLKALPTVAVRHDIHCVTRWSRFDMSFGGVLLSRLLDDAAPRAAARFVSFIARSEHDHHTSLPLDAALAAETLLALTCDAAPLTSEHGGPVRVITPGRYFYKSLKWVERIELLAVDRLGTWESESGYHNGADPWLEDRYFAPGLSRLAAAELLATLDLSGRDLRSLSAPDRDLTGLKAQRSLLRDADFRRCNLTRADFTGANLSNAHFEQARLVGATFSNADVEGANFQGADLSGVDFRGASLIGATFFDPAAAGQDATLDAATRFDAAAIDELTPPQQQFLRAKLDRKG